MKHLSLIGTVLMTLVGSNHLAAASPFAQTEKISLLELNEGTVQDFLQGKMGDLIVECPSGATLPLKLIIKGEFLSLDSEEIAPLKILKTCYVRYQPDNNFLFSTDLQNWLQFSEFFSGELKATVNAQHGKPIAGLELDLNQRKNF